MAEAAGLGDFGDAVFDEPGFVAVPQVVEVHPGDDRRDSFVGVADPAAELGAALVR